MTRLLALVLLAAGCAPAGSSDLPAQSAPHPVVIDRGGGAPYREDGATVEDGLGAWPSSRGWTPPSPPSTDTMVWLAARTATVGMLVDAVADLPDPTTTTTTTVPEPEPVELTPEQGGVVRRVTVLAVLAAAGGAT